MKNILFTIAIAAACATAFAASENLAPHLETRHGVRQLVVDGQPFLILGGELHNSSSSSREYMKRIWPRLVEKKLNTVLAAVSWELIEPEEGKFDFSSVDAFIEGARQNHLHVVFLWFGAWKNGLSSYPPLWVKTDPKRFPWVKNSAGKTLDILTTFSDATCQADAKAFAALMRHIREFDGKQHTVLMMQVENEVGIRDDSRDRSPAAIAAYAQPVPKALMNYLVRHKDTLAPELLEVWAANDNKTSGTWEEVFGPGKPASVQLYGPDLTDEKKNVLWRQLNWASDEFFMAWRYSTYVNKVAASGKAEYDIPMYCNAWQQQPGCPRPGEYPSGGPVPQVNDIWRFGAPNIDFLAPDLYIPEFDWDCARYTRNGNPLFIPEANTDGAAPHALTAFLKFNGIGFSPFGIDGFGRRRSQETNSVPPPDPLAQTYAILDYLAPVILDNQGRGTIAFLQPMDDTNAPPQELKLGDYTLSVGPNTGGGFGGRGGFGGFRGFGGGPAITNVSPARFVINTSPGAYLFVGGPANVTFTANTLGPGGVVLGSFDESMLVDGRWVPGRRLNGDETDHNRRWQNLRSYGIYRYTVFSGIEITSHSSCLGLEFSLNKPSNMNHSAFKFVLGAFLTVVAIVMSSHASTAATADLTLTNEQGSLRFTLFVDAAGPGYRVDHLDKGVATPVLERSPLGLIRTDLALTNGLAFVSASSVAAVEDDYTLASGKQLKIHSRGVERTFALRNALGIRLDLTVRAYRDGIAFRYGLPGHGSQLLQISGEATGFKLPVNGRVWTQPYSKVGIWAPAYENDYVNGVPVGTPAPAVEGWSLPLLCQTGNLWVLVTETGLEPSYFGVHLEQRADDGLYRVRLPEVPETYGVAPQAASITLPWVSPWRVIIVANQAGGVVESTLVTDLARPSELKDISWIKPGIASWSWWSDQASPEKYQKLVPFIDVAAKMGWQYSLVDLGWDRMHGGDIKQLAAYAKTKGVGLILWYNSAGKHTQVPDTSPKDVMNDPLLRDAELARIAAMGIKGIKVDFFQSDKQFVIALYHDILRDAARHHLMADFHGCTIPHGWQRTYPNLISMEAVRGEEQYWDKTYAENAQTFDTIYVFTRNAVGPMDYTPTDFTNVVATNPQSQPHLTTVAHELALLVVFESGIQHVIDPATDLMAQPDYIQDYLHGLPAAWDETRVVAGAPGELAVLARRHGRTWYLSGINGEKMAKTIQVPLAFLAAPAEISLITDGATPHEFAHRTFVAKPGDQIEVNLAARGGFATRLTIK
jgi:hypothetical protein